MNDKAPRPTSIAVCVSPNNDTMMSSTLSSVFIARNCLLSVKNWQKTSWWLRIMGLYRQSCRFIDSHWSDCWTNTFCNMFDCPLVSQPLRNKDIRRDAEIQSKMFSMMADRHNSKYFAKHGMKIKCVIKWRGPPTLFVTLWLLSGFLDLWLNVLKLSNKDIPNIDNMTPTELCCMDPVSVCIHFQWNAIFTKLFQDNSTSLLGEMEDYFWRIEYQARGAPHIRYTVSCGSNKLGRHNWNTSILSAHDRYQTSSGDSRVVASWTTKQEGPGSNPGGCR